MTIQYRYRLPAPANLKGEVVTAGNTIQGEPSRFKTVFYIIIYLFFFLLLDRSIISIFLSLSLSLYTNTPLCVCGCGPLLSHHSLTRSGQLSFLLLLSQPLDLPSKNLPYRGFASNFTSTTTTTTLSSSPPPNLRFLYTGIISSLHPSSYESLPCSSRIPAMDR